MIKTAKFPSATWAAIYIGSQCIGHVISRGPRGIEAYDRNDKSLGLFPTQPAAMDALARLIPEGS